MPARPLRGLSVEALEDRTTPAFTVSILAGGVVQFSGSDDSEFLVLFHSPDGQFLQHNLTTFQSDLASPLDMDSSLEGEQSVALADLARVHIDLGGSGDTLFVTRQMTVEVDAGDGNDYVALEGDRVSNDTVIGGAGDDFIFAGGGDDIISGGAGNDTIYGDFLERIFLTSSGNDTIDAGEGDDYVNGGAGNDDVVGGTGFDRLYESSISQARVTDTFITLDGFRTNGHGFEQVELWGTDGDDVLNASGFTLGPVTFFGFGGNNVLRGGAGDDYLDSFSELTVSTIASGGAGNDTIYVGGVMNDVRGGAGDDVITVLFSADPNAVPGVSIVRAGAGNDTVGVSAPTTVYGGAGDDIISSSGGSHVFGGGGNDTLYGVVDDVLSGGAGTDYFEFQSIGAEMVLTNTQLLADGAVLWDGHGLESGVIYANIAHTPNTVLDASAFTRGTIDLYGSDGDDVLRGAVRGGVLSGGNGNDVAVIAGTARRDALVLGETTATLNGNVFTFNETTDAIVVDLGAGVDTGVLAALPIIPYTVLGLEPAIEAGGNETVSVGSAFTRAGSFTDIGQGQTWTATVDFGDGSGPQALALAPDGSFALDHTFAKRGSYLVTVTVTDGEGNVGTARFRVRVV